MAQTSNPTTTSFYDSLRYNVGRISVVQGEVVRRLEENMPVMIEYLNDLLGHPAGKGIPLPKSYLRAPSTVLTDDYLNSMLVTVASSSSVNGAQQFKTSVQVVVYSIDRKIEHGTQVADALDRAGIAIGILNTFVDGCVDDQGRKVWRVIEMTGHQLVLPQPYDAIYCGSTAYFTVTMDQTCNCWS